MTDEVHEIDVQEILDRWKRERKIGSIELHVKDGKVLQANETTVTRSGVKPICKTS